jgi:hypothetical protein
MENIESGNRQKCRKEPIATADIDSPIIEELQQERLRQSRIIARQLDTIGKLKRALDMIVMDRSGRRGSWIAPSISIPDVIIPAEIEYSDFSLQTDPPVPAKASDADNDQVRKALGYLAEENLKLSKLQRDSEEVLKAEREKTKRILTVCSRISSSPDSGISSPALAKWVSLGLEESVFPARPRTETIDDSIVCRTAKFPLQQNDQTGSSTTRSRSALSEGDSPVAGLDLDMIYGTNYEGNSHHPQDAVPLTPRVSQSEDTMKILISNLAGSYWTGDEVMSLSISSSDLSLEGQFADDSVIQILPRGPMSSLVSLLIRQKDQTTWQMECSFRTSPTRQPCILWPDGVEWTRIHLVERMVGEWWTGFGMIFLKPSRDGSGKLVGQWGLKAIEIRAASDLSPDGCCEILCNLSNIGVEMSGSLFPKYKSSSSCVTRSMVHWGNGQVWEQQSMG